MSDPAVSKSSQKSLLLAEVKNLFSRLSTNFGSSPSATAVDVCVNIALTLSHFDLGESVDDAALELFALVESELAKPSMDVNIVEKTIVNFLCRLHEIISTTQG